MKRRLAFLPVLASGLLAQGGSSDSSTRGSLAAIPFAGSLPNPGGVALDQILFKLPGDQTTPPFAMPFAPVSNLVPDYRVAVMFATWPIAAIPLIDLDAMSSGNDRIHYDNNGIVDGDFAGGWSMLMFSVRAGAQGTGGPLQERAQAMIPVGSDLYSYLFPDSLGVEETLLDRQVLEIPGENHQLTGDLQAGDAFLPQIVLTNGVITSLTPVTDKFFFSLTAASAKALSDLYPWLPGAPYDGCTIYEIDWNQTSLSWGPVQVYRSRATMGLSVEEDVDALAVDAGPTGPSVVLSTVRGTSSNRDQILAYVSSGPNPGLVPLRANGGDKVSNRIRLHGADDVDVLCGTDPDAWSFNRQIGVPVDFDGPTPTTTKLLGISLVSDANASFASNGRLTILVSGWGTGQSGPGTVELHYLSQSTTFVIGSYHRSALQSSLTINLPAPTTPLGPFGIAARWLPAAGGTYWSYPSVMTF